MSAVVEFLDGPDALPYEEARNIYNKLAELAGALRVFLRGKKVQEDVFPKLPHRASDMLRLDLEAAGIPYVDVAGRYIDFYGLRHTFISELSRSVIHPKIAQTLAQHSTITLTMNKYTASTLLETPAEAVNKLPGRSMPDSQRLRVTGTDDSVLASCLFF